MAIYNTHQVDERYSPILEPNLYAGSIFVPGVTCTDKYQIGPAGAIMVQKLSTSPAEPGTPGRDFVDEVASSSLISIALNNNFQKSKKIYGVVAGNVSFAAAEEHMAIATSEVKEGRDQSGLASLVQEATAATLTAAITDPKADIIKTRIEISKAKGSADVVQCSPDFYGMVLEAAGKDFSPVRNDRVISTGNVGNWLGMTFIECPGLAATNAKYYDHTGTLKTVSFAGIQYVMYRAAAMSIVDNFNLARIINSEMFGGTKAQVETNVGYRVTNPVLARVRKVTA